MKSAGIGDFHTFAVGFHAGTVGPRAPRPAATIHRFEAVIAMRQKGHTQF